jgi:nucleotide-binding universal stress UspA family protein
MTHRTFLLVVFDKLEAAWLVDRAAETASGFNAHLTVLHPFAPLVFPAGMQSEPTVFSNMLEWEETESLAIRAKVEEALRRNALQGEYRAQDALFGAEAFLLHAARAADVVLIGATAERSPDERTLAHRLVREAGRPFLVLGRGASLSGPAQRILMGWNDTREATRAVHDAIGMTAPGAEVTLVSLHSAADEVSPMAGGLQDLAAALDRLGFCVTITDRPANPDARADELLRTARDMDAELLVTGAFGHSQVYDFFIGAVTRHLLDGAPIPIFLSR